MSTVTTTTREEKNMGTNSSAAVESHKLIGNAKRKRRAAVIRSVSILLLTAIMALPLYYIIVSSFKTEQDMYTNSWGLPKEWTLHNYISAFVDVNMVQAFSNTIIITVTSVALQVFIGSLAAYGMILRKSWFTSAIGALLLFSFTIPVQATIIPLAQLESDLGISEHLLGLIIVYQGSAVFCYFLIVGYMRKLPRELLEAARIDGAGPFRIYWKVVLPLIKPIITTVVVFQTLATWNDFLWPKILFNDSANYTVVLQVFYAVGERSTNWPLFMAITVVALLPVFIFFIFTQRWIVSGLVGGAVKG